jgi:Na+/proline symporter
MIFILISLYLDRISCQRSPGVASALEIPSHLCLPAVATAATPTAVAVAKGATSFATVAATM